MQLSDTDVPSKTGNGDEEQEEQEKVARLASLSLTAPDADLCMSFWYHMFGEHAGALHIKQRKEAEGGHILWTVSGHQGMRWREGRVLLPRSSVTYQVKAGVTWRERVRFKRRGVKMTRLKVCRLGRSMKETRNNLVTTCFSCLLLEDMINIHFLRPKAFSGQ